MNTLPQEELYDEENKPLEDEIPLEEITDEDEQGPALLLSEFEVALNELKNRKSEGPDGLPGDLLKALGSKGKQESFEICNQIHERREWPKEFLESIIIPIEKKSGAHDCVDFRTISLVSHASTIVLKVLTRRLESKAELCVYRQIRLNNHAGMCVVIRVTFCSFVADWFFVFSNVNSRALIGLQKESNHY